MTLKDKVIVITGASQGFGKALAKAFKQENAQVVISSHDKENLELTAQELSVDHFLADVTSFDNVKKLGEYAVEKYSKIDFWINNAGIQIAPSFVEDIDIKKLHDLFRIFLWLPSCTFTNEKAKKWSDYKYQFYCWT